MNQKKKHGEGWHGKQNILINPFNPASSTLHGHYVLPVLIPYIHRKNPNEKIYNMRKVHNRSTLKQLTSHLDHDIYGGLELPFKLSNI